MTSVIQNAIDAISLGGLYALIALGIALIFGIIRLVNFAHGDLVMVGGYTFLLLQHDGWIVIIVGVIVAVVLLAVVMERTAFRPLRDASPATLFVTSFAVSYLIESIMQIAVGSTAKSADLPLTLSQAFHIGSLRISHLDVITIAATIILVLGLGVFLKLTQFGLQMRAAAQDFRMARLLGVRADRVIAAAFAISGLLAAVVAIIVVAQTDELTPTIGQSYVLIGFVATVVGGLGSLWAAALGGLIVGVVTTVLQVELPLGLRPFRDAFVFAIIIAILVLRPQGLIVLKSEQAERV
jgi:branched-chain amino acid transport system permease protein